MNFAMISAMYENGGNTFHRHLDGHPELYVYPFESQLGTRFTSDEQTSLYPFKYRWPIFPVNGSIESDFELFFDEEAKTRLRRPDGSKFRDADLTMTEDDRRKLFVEYMKGKERNPGNLVMAFFYATFEAWKNVQKTGNEKYYVGYSPIIGIDADLMVKDMPDIKILHVVRSPVACFSETCRRPFPLSLQRYTWTWNWVQYRSLVFREMYPNNYYILKYEDMISDKKKEVMEGVSKFLGVNFADTMLYPSWNGKKLENQYPWGTIDFPDNDEQQRRIGELTNEQIAEIKTISARFMKEFGYE